MTILALPAGVAIAALASAPGPAARGILRVSGPEVRQVLDRVFDLPEGDLKTRLPTRIETEVCLPQP